MMIMLLIRIVGDYEGKFDVRKWLWACGQSAVNLVKYTKSTAVRKSTLLVFKDVELWKVLGYVSTAGLAA
jgi:hypothetical protein